MMITLPASAVLIVVAPELIGLLLGPQWTGVIRPFQILALGMMFRTSYKMGDSLARAAGKVYSQAWRQWFYAALVIIGALVGQNWGPPGVAVAVVLAVGANFLTVLHLSSRIVRIDWSKLVAGYFRYFAIAVVFGLSSFAAITAARTFELPSIISLILALSAPGLVLIVILLMRPSIFGPERLWAWSLLCSRAPILEKLAQKVTRLHS
jgi:PST family polysaccharide transporter